MNQLAQQDIPVLSESKNGLTYLTPNYWTLIADKATRKKYKPGETLVERGKQTHGVLLILKGSAKVQIPQASFPGVGPGQICGEMSFLDELPASANVIAQDAVEAYFLDRATLQSLFELFPHLASRFYRSLATNLCRRLRDMIEVKASAVQKK